MVGDVRDSATRPHIGVCAFEVRSGASLSDDRPRLRHSTVALRFLFGSRQALSNPCTGVLAIFASRLLNGNAPLIFEDGFQQRDFVRVYDVVQAGRRALDAPRAIGRAINVGRTTASIAPGPASALKRGNGRSGSRWRAQPSSMCRFIRK